MNVLKKKKHYLRYLLKSCVSGIIVANMFFTDSLVISIILQFKLLCLTLFIKDFLEDVSLSIKL